MLLKKPNSVFHALALVLIFSPVIPSHKYKPKKKGYTDHTGGISVYEVPHHNYQPPVPAYPATYYPTSFGPPTYEYETPAYPPYYPPPPPHPPYGMSYVPVCTNCDEEGGGGKKSNKGLIKSLKKEEIKLYKGLKHLTKGLWKSYKKGDESEVVTVHRPIYHPPPPPRLVEVRVPKCKDTVEIPTYVTETLIKTRNIYVTKTRTKTTERHIKEYIVNTEFQTKTATQVISHYAAPETRTVYGPAETVTVYSPPQTIVKTDYETHYHPTTQYVPHYVTVTVAPEPSYEMQSDYLEHATPFHATEQFPPSSYGEHISYAKRKVDNPSEPSPRSEGSERKSNAAKAEQNKQTPPQ